MLELLEAPVPFIVGCVLETGVRVFNRDLIAVDVSSRGGAEPYYLDEVATPIPPLPQQEALVAALEPHHEALRQLVRAPPPGEEEGEGELLQAVAAFLGVLRGHLCTIAARVAAHRITEQGSDVTIFLQSSLLASAEESEKSFFSLFVQAQCFEQFFQISLRS
mmetsp:Transcript_26578/g.74303  ORF Transcript_26578/g.74303 Transcript_26578/m.74303 type:complete len:163 (-) Transcript_26578:771-1259(-)